MGLRGFFFIWVLLCIAFQSVLLSAILTRTTSEQWAARRFADHEQAFQLAEAGIDDALRILQASSVSWNDELVGADGIPGTADDGLLPEIGLITEMPTGSQHWYTVRIRDNDDELAPTPNDPTVDVDGIIQIEAVGTTPWHQRAVMVSLWALFNHAIAAEGDIVSSENSFFGNIHANHDIIVNEAGVMVGNAQATASGTFVFGPGVTLLQTGGDLVGGDPRILFPRPDAAALQAAVARWNPPNTAGDIVLADQEIAGVNVPLNVFPNSPNTVVVDPPNGAATLVVFNGHSITFREQIGLYDALGLTCLQPVNVNIIVLGGGSITFNERTCLRGLIWAEGPVHLGERSNISGAVVSAGGSVTLAESSRVTFDRSAINPALLPGFSGSTILSWQER